MEQTTCTCCNGTGKISRGTFAPLDPNYDYAKTTLYRNNPEIVQALCARMPLVREGGQVLIRDHWRDVYEVGMYDGWPYWAPMPAVRRSGPLGPEISFWYDIEGVR